MFASQLFKFLCFINHPSSTIHKPLAITESSECQIWRRVNEDISLKGKPAHIYWWNYVGSALAIFLHHANYSPDAQYAHLSFFVGTIVPNLGPSFHPSRPWKSFMTDDGNPVELSWEWTCTGTRPKIRYSIEPIGTRAGTMLDPSNRKITRRFEQQLFAALPETDLVWYRHFDQEFQCNSNIGALNKSTEHSTNRFFGFDLEQHQVVAKAYFFPKYRARKAGQPILDIMFQAISRAPGWGQAGSQALDKFKNFATDDGALSPLQFDIFAIDMVAPHKSRIKIYFRCWETDFLSVVKCLTLNNQIDNAAAQKGIENLRLLWDALFQVDSAAGKTLQRVSHETAGILFNIEIKPEKAEPIVKIYLPVRHYALSDQSIIKTLSTYFQFNGPNNQVSEYQSAMSSIFDKKAMQALSGLHTYIGVSIRPEGNLRVVSYLNIQRSKMKG